MNTGMIPVFEEKMQKLLKKIEKEYEKNSEKGLGMINQLGSYVGMKVTDKKQEKNRLFLKFGDNIQDHLCWIQATCIKWFII